jgi:hypothetical protein
VCLKKFVIAQSPKMIPSPLFGTGQFTCQSTGLGAEKLTHWIQ